MIVARGKADGPNAGTLPAAPPPPRDSLRGGGMSDHSQEETDHLNSAALGALMGYHSDWKRPLIELLRSDAPIGPAVRITMAEAIEGTHSFGITFALSGHQAQSKRIEGMLVRRKWLEDGRAVRPFLEHVSNVQDGFEAAAASFGRDDSHWRKRHYYAVNCEAWIKVAKAEGHFYSRFPDCHLEDVWHLASFDQKEDINPAPLTGPEHDAVIKARLEFLAHVRESSGRTSSAEFDRLYTSAMMALFHLSPPESG